MEALFSLLNDKNLSEIGISELIEKAGVARSSFYRNFASLEEILQYELEHLVDSYIEQCPLGYVDYADLDYMIWKFGFYKKYAQKILILKETGLSSPLVSTINRISLNGIDQDSLDTEGNVRIYFGAGAFYNVTMHWLETGAKETPEEIAKIFCSLYVQGAQAAQ